MTGINNFTMEHKKNSQAYNSELEEFFQNFWLGIEERFKKEAKSKLEQEILELKKKELWRKYISIIAMVPFAVSMAITLEAVCSNWVLLGLISSALSHTIMPFEALSLICALYLIYNNRKIKKKEQELIDIESEKVGKNNTAYDNDDYLHCIETVTTTLCILGDIVSEALSQGIIEDITFLFSNLVGFYISCTFYYSEYNNKSKEQNFNTDEKSGSNITAAKLMLAGSSMLLIRRVMLVALASSLSATTISSAIAPAIGLVGMICFMAGYALTICSYSSKLEDLEVSGKGAATGAASNIIGSKTSYNSCEAEGVSI